MTIGCASDAVDIEERLPLLACGTDRRQPYGVCRPARLAADRAAARGHAREVGIVAGLPTNENNMPETDARLMPAFLDASCVHCDRFDADLSIG
jgi:hypothetical protein